jgi:hypothetical protein
MPLHFQFFHHYFYYHFLEYKEAELVMLCLVRSNKLILVPPHFINSTHSFPHNLSKHKRELKINSQVVDKFYFHFLSVQDNQINKKAFKNKKNCIH